MRILKGWPQVTDGELTPLRKKRRHFGMDFLLLGNPVYATGNGIIKK